MPEISKKCVRCEQEFAIVPLEQEILSKLKLEHPTQCYFCRQARRLKTRMQGYFHKTTCRNCNKEIYTTTNPEAGFLIYCKECYLAFKASGKAEQTFLDLD